MSIQITGGAGLQTTGGTLTGPLEIAVGSAAAPGLAVAGDSNTGLWAPAADTLAVSTGGVERLRVTLANLFLGDNANGFSTQGLTINQLGNDDEVLALKSSDVAHGRTAATETDTFGTFKKAHAAGGGLVVAGYSEGATAGIIIAGILGLNNPVDTVSAVIFQANKADGSTGLTDVGASETAFQFKNYGTDLVTILGGGNVGIGTTQPGGLLHIAKLATDNPIYIDKYSSNVGHAATLQFRTSQQDTIGNTATTVGNVHGRLEWYGNNGITFQRSAYIGVSQGSSTVTDGNLTISSGASGTIFMDGSTGNVGIQIAAPTAALHLPVSTTARASLRIPAGTAPTIPNAGDIWAEGAVLKFFNGTTTQEIAFV